jgi:hypothetical protein
MAAKTCAEVQNFRYVMRNVKKRDESAERKEK